MMGLVGVRGPFDRAVGTELAGHGRVRTLARAVPRAGIPCTG